MKKTAYLTAVIAGAMMFSCNEPNRVTNTENDYENSTSADRTETTRSTSGADNDYASEWRRDRDEFKAEVREKIDRFDAEIEELKAKVKGETAEAKAEYNEEVAELKAKNERLKSRLNDNDDDTNEEWREFRTEFERDMNELGTAIRNIGRDDNK